MEHYLEYLGTLWDIFHANKKYCFFGTISGQYFSFRDTFFVCLFVVRDKKPMFALFCFGRGVFLYQFWAFSTYTPSVDVVRISAPPRTATDSSGHHTVVAARVAVLLHHIRHINIRSHCFFLALSSLFYGNVQEC